MNKLTNLSVNLKGIKYGDRLKPSRDWLVLLSATLVLLLASIVWNLWTFSHVTKGDAVGNEASPARNDMSFIESAEQVFQERRAEEQRYRTEYRFVDPSLGSR